VTAADIQVLDPDTFSAGLPHAQFEYLRSHHPCFDQHIRDPAMIDRSWVLSRYSDIARAGRDTERFSSAQGVRLEPNMMAVKGRGKPSLITMDGSDHLRNRKIVARAFTPKTLLQVEHQLRARAAELVNRAADERTFDFIDVVATEMPMHSLCDLMNVPDQDRRQLLEWSDLVVNPTDTRVAASADDVAHAYRSLWAYGLRLAEQRRRRPGGDFFSKIVEAVDDDTLDDDELMGFTALLVAAGIETVRDGLSLALHHLLQDREQLAWLRDRADRVPESAVEELLRHSCPVMCMRRTATVDMLLHGCRIAAGDPVALQFASANFDPRVFDDPYRLDLQRSPNRHMSFGHGPHVCLGAYASRLQIRIVLEELLRRTATLEPAGPIVYGRNALTRQVRRLPITVTPR
jgi:cholest-4-en-3-one 26-monooxygenase